MPRWRPRSARRPPRARPSPTAVRLAEILSLYMSTDSPADPAIFALFGPTAVGKTAIAVALAERLRECGGDPVAVSADALQVYVGLETLTGVASAGERAALE